LEIPRGDVLALDIVAGQSLRALKQFGDLIFTGSPSYLIALPLVSAVSGRDSRAVSWSVGRTFLAGYTIESLHRFLNIEGDRG